METLREHLRIDTWLIFGGSWGSTLALAYGIHHPKQCLGFILRGIFLGTAKELDWFINGIATIFPEEHRNFKNFLPAREQHALLESYHRRLVDPDPKIHFPAACSWSRFESLCSTLLPGKLAQSSPPNRDDPPTGEMGQLAISRLEIHYFWNFMFLEENFIINNLYKLDGLPAIIIQGRYDIICPSVSADKLARRWPDGLNTVTTKIVNDAGHSAMEPGIRSALVQATDQFRSRARPLSFWTTKG
jgi:proline iminopeptidase